MSPDFDQSVYDREALWTQSHNKSTLTDTADNILVSTMDLVMFETFCFCLRFFFNFVVDQIFRLTELRFAVIPAE